MRSAREDKRAALVRAHEQTSLVPTIVCIVGALAGIAVLAANPPSSLLPSAVAAARGAAKAALPAPLAGQAGGQKHKYRSDGTYTPGEDGTYAQNYQDVWFESVARHNGWLPGAGFYLDLGAFRPLECSNSAKLDLEHKWEGVSVEPREGMGFREKRPRTVEVVRAMKGTSGEIVEMGGPGGQLNHIIKKQEKDGKKTMRTISPRDLLTCVNGTAKEGTDCSGVSRKVPVPGFIPFVSMDVEGNEADVLKAWPWDLVDVGVFILETNAGLDCGSGCTCNHNCKEARKRMSEKGYVSRKVNRAGVDEYFVRDKHWDPKLSAKEWRVHPPGSGGC
mmetsp:Transcript_29816/g.75033  ORF Transcript_29816/g.75033 Transcript_29816/m.75033 type:complete len:333 (+) Transcript_29816:218-1216(+)